MQHFVTNTASGALPRPPPGALNLDFTGS